MSICGLHGPTAGGAGWRSILRRKLSSRGKGNALGLPWVRGTAFDLLVSSVPCWALSSTPDPSPTADFAPWGLSEHPSTVGSSRADPAGTEATGVSRKARCLCTNKCDLPVSNVCPAGWSGRSPRAGGPGHLPDPHPHVGWGLSGVSLAGGAARQPGKAQLRPLLAHLSAPTAPMFAERLLALRKPPFPAGAQPGVRPSCWRPLHSSPRADGQGGPAAPKLIG